MNVQHPFNPSFCVKIFMALCIFCMIQNIAHSQDTLQIYSTPVVGTTHAEVDFKVDNFNDMLAFQFTLNWDPSLLQLDSFSTPFTSQNFRVGYSFIDQGKLIVTWFNQNITGTSLPDGSSLIKLQFSALRLGTNNIFINGIPTEIEFVNASSQIVPYDLGPPSQVTIKEVAQLTGTVFNDEGNCLYDGNEVGLKDWTIRLEGTVDTFFTSTDSDGKYSLLADTGTYQLIVLAPQFNFWEACQDTFDITLANLDTTVNEDIPVLTVLECAQMEVDISTPRLRRCFPNTYTVRYCNIGTLSEPDANIEIYLDPFMEMNGASIPFTQMGDSLSFPIGQVNPGECAQFTFEVTIDCDSTILGQAHCVEARIFPDTLCVEERPGWNRASIKVEGKCVNNEVKFDIINVGEGDMTLPSNYIVIEDVIIFRDEPFQLNAAEKLTITFEGDGSTYRLEAGQVLNHPGFSMPSAMVEGCGVDSTGNFTTGIITSYPNDDADPVVDIDCQQNIGSFDPNDKQGFPTGYGPEHFLEANTDIEYMIRFQNTGTDTAFRVVVVDTLSEFLNMRSLQLGTSSHPYDFEVIGENVINFTFDNIMLPDSNVNEPASNGFINFKISQKPDNPLGTVIMNDAAIYFDFNKPIITNTTVHTIGKDFLPVKTIEVFVPDVQIQAYPNPFSESTTIKISGKRYEKSQIKVFDASGRLLQQKLIYENSVEIKRTELSPGLYFFLLESSDARTIGTGKLMVLD